MVKKITKEGFKQDRVPGNIVEPLKIIPHKLSACVVVKNGEEAFWFPHNQCKVEELAITFNGKAEDNVIVQVKITNNTSNSSVTATYKLLKKVEKIPTENYNLIFGDYLIFSYTSQKTFKGNIFISLIYRNRS